MIKIHDKISLIIIQNNVNSVREQKNKEMFSGLQKFCNILGIVGKMIENFKNMYKNINKTNIQEKKPRRDSNFVVKVNGKNIKKYSAFYKRDVS